MPEQNTSNMKPSNNPADSPLLSLPPEIRNMIYRYVLVEGTIQMQLGDGPAQSPLLQVNSQSRIEAIKIYYQENCFRWQMWAFDAADYIVWCRTSKIRSEALCRWSLKGPPNWQNLLNWLEAYHKRDSRALETPSKSLSKTLRAPVVATLLRLVKKLGSEQHFKWQEIKAYLEIVHNGICAIDEKWELGRDAS